MSTYLQLETLNQQRNSFLDRDIPFNFTTKNSLATERKGQQWPQLAKKSKQSVLLLKGPKQQYTLQTDYAVPSISHQNEILVKVILPIGLTIPVPTDCLRWLPSA